MDDSWVHVNSVAEEDLDFTNDIDLPGSKPTPEERRRAEQQTVTGMRSLDRAGYYVNILSRPGKLIAPRAGDKHSILIIDYDQANVLLLARTLLLAQFDVRSASTREQLAAELKRQPVPDAIVMDIVLRGLNGLDLLAHLRQHARFAGVPVIVMTAKLEQDDVIAALARGASGYMTKPFKPEALLDTVKAVLGLG